MERRVHNILQRAMFYQAHIVVGQAEAINRSRRRPLPGSSVSDEQLEANRFMSLFSGPYISNSLFPVSRNSRMESNFRSGSGGGTEEIQLDGRLD
ncbi:unnamed protein product [Gongylonema pulchrum]|nr:unnamed protein product [Gongylonema pulchrum]